MIKAVIFDCFGVLTTDLLRDYTASLPAEIMPDVHDLIHARGAGRLNREDFVDQLTNVTGRDRQEIAHVTVPGGSKNIRLFEFISQLKLRGYKIGLLSNVGSDWVKTQFLTADEQKLFDDILLSYEVNMVKPDPKIYNLAVERLGVGIVDSVLIDDIDRYCEAAEQEGMQAVLYQNFDQAKAELEVLLAKP